mmetsp:Transcript_76939/g.213786  ORF Transcript_76939/g.213786 Transcript_76939/m.213786 type:complete len:260 (-) Transcript_76939:309-1088(-)
MRLSLYCLSKRLIMTCRFVLGGFSGRSVQRDALSGIVLQTLSASTPLGRSDQTVKRPVLRAVTDAAAGATLMDPTEGSTGRGIPGLSATSGVSLDPSDIMGDNLENPTGARHPDSMNVTADAFDDVRLMGDAGCACGSDWVTVNLPLVIAPGSDGVGFGVVVPFGKGHGGAALATRPPAFASGASKFAGGTDADEEAVAVGAGTVAPCEAPAETERCISFAGDCAGIWASGDGAICAWVKCCEVCGSLHPSPDVAVPAV